MSYKPTHEAYHQLHSRDSFLAGMKRLSSTTRSHKVRGGTYTKDKLGMVYFSPTKGSKQLIELNDASGNVWRQIKQER